jgi:hypothetical protein
VTRRATGVRAATFVLGAAFAWISAATAQEGPVVVGELEQPPRFHLESPDVALTLQTIYTNNRVTEAGGTTRFRQYRFDEILSLSTTGHIIHPNLVALELGGSFGLSQTRHRDNGSGGGESGEIFEFDTRATFFQNQPATPSLFARRNRSIVSRTFGPTLESITTIYGGGLSLQMWDTSTQLQAFRTEVRQNELTGVTDFSLNQNTFLWHTSLAPAENQRLTWDYSYNDVEQATPFFGTRFDTHEARLVHSWDFGPADRHNLTSTLHYFDQSGAFDVRRFRWDESLRLQHTDSFLTRYRYSFEHRDNGFADQTMHRATAGFRHRLYESLVTTGTAGFQRFDHSGGETSLETFGDLGFNYRKKVPYGLFTSRLGLGISRLDADARVDPIRVIDDPRAFADSLPIVLTGRNIVPGSLVVTDPSGLVIFTPGVDYRVGAFGDRVEIERVIGGRLDAGDTVLLDYLLAPQPAHVTTTGTFSLNGRYDIQRGDLRGLSFYSRYIQQEQRIDTDVPAAFVANDFRDLLVGSEYRIGNFTFGAERQWRDAEILPLEATRFFGRWQERVAVDTTVSLNSAYTIIDYTELDNRVTLLTLSAQARHQFSQRLYGIGTILWRDEDDRFRGRTRGFEQQLELQWRYRQTHLYMMLRNADLRSNNRDSSFQFFQLGMRREF